MSARRCYSRDEARERVEKLRGRLGLFSFQNDLPASEVSTPNDSLADLEVRSGSIVELVVARPGSGAVTSALQVMSRFLSGSGICAIVDPTGECYPLALTGWGLDPRQLLFLRPATLRESCWATEQCLRCPGISATWAWVGGGVPEQVHRRWQLAAELGGGVGLFFRPEMARREPVWADLRVLVTPQVGGIGETRRVHIEILYRRGGRGGNPRSWEIDHAEGLVRLVPQVANPAPLAQGPSLTDRSWRFSPPRISVLRLLFAARASSARAFILASPWPKPRLSSRAGYFFERISPKTSNPSAS